MEKLENIIKKGFIFLIIYLIVGLFVLFASSRFEALERGVGNSRVSYTLNK